jgi:predicted MFS family arabinose efflux permease
MQVPVRLLTALRPSVAPALLVAVASSTVVFVSTPFLLAGVAEQRDVSLGTVGWISTTQLLGFVVASFLGGRYLTPVRSVFVGGAILGCVANLLSAVSPTLLALSGARLLSGLSLGLAAWFGWQAAFGDAEKTGDVAVIGPLVGVVTAPAVSALVESVGIDWLFVVLAAVTATPLLFAHKVPRIVQRAKRPERHAPTRAARVILISLILITLGGSSVFIFAAAIGTGLNGLDPFTVSILFSCNSLVAIPAAKWRGNRGPAGFWYFCTALMAILIASVRNQWLFGFGLVAWGFVFFMATPAVFGLLASRSAYPSERAGDAQAVMALGRVFGPLFGGALISHGSSVALGFCAAAVIGAASLALLYVDRRTLPVIGARLA